MYEKEVCEEFTHTTNHGALSNKTQTNYVKNYNLDMIISVGYRVNSRRATQFRKWATGIEAKNTATVSRIIKETIKDSKITIYDENVGTRARTYISWWAK